jgi:hypothetical protein
MASPRRLEVPASCAGLDPEVVEQAFVAASGNMSETARALGVASADLRAFMRSTPSLAEAMLERLEEEIDAAVAVLLSALRSPYPSRRLKAATYLLRHTEAGRARFGKPIKPLKAGPEPVVITWVD